MVAKARRIIVECKDVGILKAKHVAATLKKYRYPYYADRYDIFIPRRTSVPSETREYAQGRNVKIRRVRF